MLESQMRPDFDGRTSEAAESLPETSSVGNYRASRERDGRDDREPTVDVDALVQANLPGWGAFQRGDLKSAIDLLHDFLVRSCPSTSQRVMALQLLGIAYRDQRRPRQAVQAFEAAQRLQSNLMPLSRLFLGESYGRVGRMTEAKQTFLELADNGSIEPDVLRLAAAGLSSIGEYQAATKVCRLARQLLPNSAQLAYDLAYYLGRCTDDLNRVEWLMWHALEQEGSRMMHRVGLAVFLCRHREFDKAHFLVRSIEPDDIEQLDCQECAESLAELFDLKRDEVRAKLMRDHAVALQAQATQYLFQ